jgi:hypothetical protein
MPVTMKIPPPTTGSSVGAMASGRVLYLLDGSFPYPEPIGSDILIYQLNAIVPSANMVVLGKLPLRIGMVWPFPVFFGKTRKSGEATTRAIEPGNQSRPRDSFEAVTEGASQACDRE